MRGLLRETHGLAQPLVSNAGLAFELDLPGEDIVLETDRRRVTQVVLNLVANAAKYNREGSFVRLSASAEADRLVVCVEDDGPGVDAADRARLFTAFDRLGQQKRGKIEGTGLGLALSKSLVESMGGEIGYAPREPGARFWFSLPRHAARVPEAADNELQKDEDRIA